MQVLIAVFFTMVAGMLQPLTHMSLYIADRQFYLVDAADNLYSPLAYYIAQTIISLPVITITGQVRLSRWPLAAFPLLATHVYVFF